MSRRPAPARPQPLPSPLASWPPAWTPAAVIFDCDGLLVDTESRWVVLQDAYLASHGAAFDETTRRAVTGQSAKVVVTTIAEHVGKEPLVVADELFAAHREDVTEQEPPLPGAVEIVRAAAAAVPVAVASNSPRDMLDAKLAAIGLLDVVDATVSIDDVAHGKPAPDLYLTAAAALGAAPGDCLALEDSEVGGRAATSAGLHLLAVPSVPGQAPEAPRTLASLEDPVLREWVAGWERRR
ncbi:haloacid dehalogenase [Brachybacterium sp. SGAir0954]|uniref:HAD family hydrolase n=1 Tax=Brachybacterium sp. SGAir0954 TaxID=2571029 RepID=UPI0010CCB7B0|nr:HAD family phosphatase [Brachybacterium sp. SGAir0954]QCR53174.1 haloacid dehalogenase [Brachybacterium sp. SGAir0954]